MLAYYNSYPEMHIRKVKGNKPLRLDTDQKVWIVKSGKVDIFFYSVDEGGRKGKRNFWVEAHEGDLLLGIQDHYYHLVAVGMGNCELVEINHENWLASFREEKTFEWVKQMMSRWMGKVGQMPIGHDDVYLLWDEIQREHLIALQKAIDLYKEQEIIDRDLTEERLKKDQWFMSAGIQSLATIMEKKSNKRITLDARADFLLQAAMYVGKAMNIDIKSPVIKKGKMTLDQIARTSMIRTREVALKGEWWKEDNGPLVAYMEEDNRPVALIAKSPTRYELIDVKNNQVTTINAPIAETIKPIATYFYRSFPSKALNKQDLFKFALENCWKRDIGAIALIGIIGGLIGMATPVATGILFGSIIPEGEKVLMVQIGFFLAAMGISNVIFEVTRSLATLRVEGKAEVAVQSGVWDRLLSLPVPFFKDYTSGELAMRAMGISEIRSILSGVAISTVISSIFSVFYLILLFYYSAKLARVVVIIVSIVVAISILIGYMQLKYERQLVDANNKITGLVLQLLMGISKFKMAGAEKRAFYQWTKKYATVQSLTYRTEVIGNILETINSGVSIITYMAIYFAFLKFADNKLTPGKFIAFQSAFGSFMGAALSLSGVLLQLNGIIPLYERAKPILETIPEYDELKGDVGELEGDIEINNINFRYKKDSPLVLKDISIHIKKGDYVAIVGSSGSGKSTLLRILLGFEEAESGRVYYDNKDMQKVDIRSIRRQLGVVLQNGKLMAGDIFSNITGASTSLTIKDAQEAIKMAGMEEDIKSMPMGLNTVISEGASTISGGQRQRLLIARAIVNKPKIIFFDEATSALDNQTQSIVSESLESMKATRVVIAHRLSTILQCDRIIVMDQGEVVEQGSYEELMEKNGLFYELAKRQLA